MQGENNYIYKHKIGKPVADQLVSCYYSGMETIAVIEETKKYVVLKVPRSMMRRVGLNMSNLSEEAALKILRQGMNEYRVGKTKALESLRDLRYDTSRN